jgi:hypothetical protein
LIEIFEAEGGVDSAFMYLFAAYELPHRGDPSSDLDMVSYGVVKVLEEREGRGVRYPDMRWEPKGAFMTLADCYACKAPPGSAAE